MKNRMLAVLLSLAFLSSLMLSGCAQEETTVNHVSGGVEATQAPEEASETQTPAQDTVSAERMHSVPSNI